MSSQAEKGGKDGLDPDSDVARCLDAALRDPDLISRIRGLTEALHHRGINICLMGAEGAGKTTLAQQLEILFAHAGMPIERRHTYGFINNALVAPFVLLWNRYVGGKVIIFDRAIYDNLANFTVARQWAAGWLPFLLMIFRPWYPRHDCNFYLEATPDDTLKRRTRTDVDRLQRFLLAYRSIADSVGFETFVTTPPLLMGVVDSVLSRYD